MQSYSAEKKATFSLIQLLYSQSTSIPVRSVSGTVSETRSDFPLLVENGWISD